MSSSPARISSSANLWGEIMTNGEVELEVHGMSQDSVWMDYACIDKSHRPKIPSGALCRLWCKGKSRLVIIDSLPSRDTNERENGKDWIRIDAKTRSWFGVHRTKEGKPAERHKFKISAVPRWRLWWDEMV
jgi:hypothetical protein